MAMTETKIKEVPGLREPIGKEIVGNFNATAILGIFSWGLIFHAWGPAKGVSTLLGYIAPVNQKMFSPASSILTLQQ